MPAASYVVINKPHRRVEWNGALRKFEVGDVIDGLTLSDLKAFPDRFRAATSAQVAAYHERHEAELALLDETPLIADAQQAAAQEEALEQEMVALQARIATAKQRTAFTAQMQAAALAPHGETKGLSEMTEAERAVANQAAAQRVDAERQAAAQVEAERQAAAKAKR